MSGTIDEFVAKMSFKFVDAEPRRSAESWYPRLSHPVKKKIAVGQWEYDMVEFTQMHSEAQRLIAEQARQLSRLAEEVAKHEATLRSIRSLAFVQSQQ